MSKVETNTIDTVSGSSTMQIGSTNTTTINLGVSGDTINVPAGVTIANAGTATGFGEANTPYFLAKRTTNQSVNDGQIELVEYDTVDLDTASGFTTGASAKYTVQSGDAGKYYLENSVQGDGGGPGALIAVAGYIYKNGSNIAATNNSLNNNNGDILTVKASVIVDLAVGDYVQFYGNVDNSTGTNMRFNGYSTARTYCLGFKVAT